MTVAFWLALYNTFMERRSRMHDKWGEMLTNARDDEEKSKERNACLLESIEKMDRRLAGTRADMTRLKDAQVH